MKALRKALRRPSVACGIISLLVLAAVLGVRARGWLQRPELIAYDFLIRWNSDANSTDDRIVLVGMTEDDLVKYGYPLDDAKLAELLTKLDQLNPCVVGLDLYRDLPEPRDKRLYPQLETALKKLARVLAITRVGYFDAPAALANDPGRVVANNLPKDRTIDGYYRRAPLFIETHVAEPMQSLSLALVLAYLEKSGTDFSLENGLLRLGKTVFPRLMPNAGAYVGLPVEDYEYLADFRAPRRFRIQDPRGQNGRDTPYDFSFSDVLDGKIPPDALRGKIVLVATVMQSIKDSNPTPIYDNLRGVQIHAMMVHQLLRAALDGVKPMTWWPEWAEVFWIAAFTLAGGALSLWLRSPWKLAPALAVVLGALHLAVWLSFKNGTWLLVAAPVIGCFVTATFVTSFTAYLERLERDAMQSLFSRHVSTKVADALWAEREQFLDGGRLKPQRLTATVLFTDLKGFSTISEGMDPPSLLSWINEYMTGVARHVDGHNGMVNAYVGDAIMAVFGAPVPHTREEDIDQDAVNAVECALAMRRELKQLNAGWAARGMPTCAMRVGIFTGPLVAGSIGSAQRLEFTVLGDTTNTAARLEAAGKEVEVDENTALCTILIGEPTWLRLHGRFETKLVGPMSLKGKAKQVIVHSVISAASKTPPSS
ncbi:MAG TPA: adenylate/guanylate cyclase domain-containing protein [Chthoniobacteraceae bacterium]|nr:adenylate/guanylate cyclase domain-containing protein [Chthoniobacteraceae bacterium]